MKKKKQIILNNFEFEQSTKKSKRKNIINLKLNFEKKKKNSRSKHKCFLPHLKFLQVQRNRIESINWNVLTILPLKIKAFLISCRFPRIISVVYRNQSIIGIKTRCKKYLKSQREIRLFVFLLILIRLYQ